MSQNIKRKNRFLIAIGGGLMSLGLLAGMVMAMEPIPSSEEFARNQLATLSPDTSDMLTQFPYEGDFKHKLTFFLEQNGEFITQGDIEILFGVINALERSIAQSQLDHVIAESIESKNRHDQCLADEAFAKQYENQSGQNLGPLSQKIIQRLRDLQVGTDAEQKSFQKFHKILSYLRGIEEKRRDELKQNPNAPEPNVHMLDDYVFGGPNKIVDLVEFANLLDIANGSLSLAQVCQEMQDFISNNKALFEGFKVVDEFVSIDRLQGYINQHFINMDMESENVCSSAKIIWSRAWSLAKKLYDVEGNRTFYKILLDSVCESYTTQGGCLQGRINRGFIGYIKILTSYL